MPRRTRSKRCCAITSMGLLHRRGLPAAPERGKPRQIEATIPAAYLDWLRVECADVSLLGQERQQGQALT